MSIKSNNIEGYIRKLVREVILEMNDSVKEAYFTPSSGTKASGTHNLDYRKYLLKKDITGAKIGSYYNVTLPKGTIIYNLPGGVFAEHPSLKKYEDGLKRYHNNDKYGGIMITSTKDIIFSIEKNSRILESIDEAKDPEIITQLRDVLQNGYKTLKDPKSGKKMKVDTYSASAIVGVYDKLNPSNQEKFVKQGLLGMQSLAFKLLK
jgi:hypothetical protein